MRHTIKFLTTLLLLTVLATVQPATAQAPADFDGDGTSDLVSVKANSSKELVWSAVFSSSGQAGVLGTLGKDGDMIAMGRWLGSGVQIGTVAVNKTNDSLTWSILNEANSRTDLSFGKKGDLALAGGDYDGNGVADALVVRLLEGKAIWQVLYNPFTDPSSEARSFTFGQTGDRAFFARIDSSGADWVGMVRQGAGRNSQARMRNLVTGEVRTLTRLPAFASQGSRPRPFPVRLSSGLDALGFVVPKGTSTTLRIFSTGGVELGSALIEGSADVAVGEFGPTEGYEVVVSSAVEAGVFNLSTGEMRALTPLSGVPADQVSVMTLGGATPTAGGAVPENNGVSGPSGSCSSVQSLPSTYIYKTRGSDHFTDIRRNTIGLILKPGAPGPLPDCVTVQASNGKILLQLGLYARGAGWTARYYSGIGCGASTPLGGAAVANLARSASGSTGIVFNMGGTCYGPADATRCYNSSSC